ncbi:MAG: AAA family ATPase [Erysipelotrichaceae bacterium]
MKILKIRVKGLKLFQDELEIDFLAQQRVRNENNDSLYKISPQIYQNNVLAFMGRNASGKTTTLKVISFVIQMLNNEPINKIKVNEVLSGIAGDDVVTIETYFSVESRIIYKLCTTIMKDERNNDNEYVIANEKIWEKDIKKIKTKKSIFDFSDIDFLQSRSGDELYLPEDISIVIALNKKNNSKIDYKDLIKWTNMNLIRVLGDFPQELISFLDPSIEYLTTVFNVKDEKDQKEIEIRIKFYGKDEIILFNPLALEKYLSSGTIKGVNVFINAISVLGNGGYLILDELENHFNKEIAATLIRFFMNYNVNSKGACIIFSTHYSELLDEFERNDNIFVVKNDSGIIVENLSKLLSRNDIKKSEIFQSGYIEGTAPTYEGYINLKRAIISEIKDEV